MDKTNLIIQNRLREATVSLERASLLHCDENWKCEYSVPPFSSIGLILEGEGVICVNQKPIHPAKRPALSASFQYPADLFDNRFQSLP